MQGNTAQNRKTKTKNKTGDIVVQINLPLMKQDTRLAGLTSYQSYTNLLFQCVLTWIQVPTTLQCNVLKWVYALINY